MSVVEIKKVTKVFGSGHTAVKAVDDVSLSVAAGDIVLVMGPSGSGKTTLISIIGTLMRASEGQVLLQGKDVARLTNNDLAELRLRELGFVFQAFNLLSALNAVDNVMIPGRLAGMSSKEARTKAAGLLEKLHLEKRLRSLPKDLSGGEKQRVAVARALMNDPKLILADEPTANLDSKTGHEVMQLLCEIACAEGRAVIIVSHDARLRDIAKRVTTIEDGRLAKEEVGNHNHNCPLHRQGGHQGE
ncbi:MAG TPA: ABC transporter ATP-binding protein [Candidatus Saccharimonadales bacterium]|nr:ABC transporter ATP-binding protein [Candidatus Saccharimonadales bacterium]